MTLSRQERHKARAELLAAETRERNPFHFRTQDALIHLRPGRAWIELLGATVELPQGTKAVLHARELTIREYPA
jgi:hypothetical protein